MARRKRKSETFDDRDEAIIHCIEQDPAILLKAIPNAISARGGKPIPYPTVQRRVKDLIRVGVVEHRYYINWSKAGYLVRYRVGILIDPVALRKRGAKSDDYETQEELALFIKQKLAQTEAFRNKLVVDDVHILLGASVDLSVDFYARDDKTATEFIINALRQQRGISNTVSAKLAFSSRYGWLSKDGNEHRS